MPKTQVNCPNCKQPVVVEIQQSFDVSQDPLAKQKILTNAVNFLQCPTCGYQGMLGVPIVYHDPDKELLLTFFPPDLNTPVNEQEKQIGPLITCIIDQLPKEKRKAYLLQPKAMLTYQTLIEKILEADGITKDMIEDQQKRINLIERLLQSKKEEREKIIKEEESLIDVNFFTLFSRIVQSASAQGDKNAQQTLLEIQQQLFETTKVGKDIYKNAKDTEEAIKKLQEASKEGLTREKLLSLLLEAENEVQLSTIASLARSGIDYTFFQMLSNQIEETAKEDKKKQLTALREKLLNITSEIDKRLQEEMNQASQNLKTLLEAENIENEIMKNPDMLNEFFLQNLENELKQARKAGDLEKINKLEKVMIVVERTMGPSEEVALLEDFLTFEDENQLDEKIKENIENITPEFLAVVNNVVAQTENQQDQPELVEKIKKVYKAVLRASMIKNKMSAE